MILLSGVQISTNQNETCSKTQSSGIKEELAN